MSPCAPGLSLAYPRRSGRLQSGGGLLPRSHKLGGNELRYYLGARVKTGCLADLGNKFLPLQGHDVDTSYSFDLF